VSQSVVDMRSEARRIADRRADAIAQHPATISKQCPSHASLLHRVAAFITTEDLPPATVRVTPAAEVFIDATGSDLVQNCVRRYAAALDLPVTEAPYDNDSGFAAVQWSTSGYDGGTGLWWSVSGHELLPTPVVDRFGIGLVSS
jgi:hypothetical protein